ncbi:MAG: hypothetical protein GY941_18440 [Planctomycetes bacterium]|nr:hypothetical protein [Planctomycetota bacterium]
MSEEKTKAWNSLEITKLIISASIPIVVALVGYFLSEQIKADTDARKRQLVLQEQQYKSELSENRVS